jgi:hypothetical protein
MKTKFYLAKSNRANPDDVSRVRKLLSKYPNEIEIVEFKGGGYSHKDLLNSDILIIVPDLIDFDAEENNAIPIGKGLHEQILAFQGKHINSHKWEILVVYETSESWISVTTIDCLDCADEDDYVNYSTILIDDENGCPLESLLMNRFISGIYDEITSINKYKYLLIGK